MCEVFFFFRFNCEKKKNLPRINERERNMQKNTNTL